jgi:hypothetical protein
LAQRDNSCIWIIRYTKIHPFDRRLPTPLIDLTTAATNHTCLPPALSEIRRRPLWEASPTPNAAEIRIGVRDASHSTPSNSITERGRSDAAQIHAIRFGLGDWLSRVIVRSKCQ